MKYLLISRHTGGREVPENEKEAHLKAFGEWLQYVNPITAIPVHGGVTVTSKGTQEYRENIAGALIFEADSLEEAIAKTQKSPGLKYGWSHDVLNEMPM